MTSVVSVSYIPTLLAKLKLDPEDRLNYLRMDEETIRIIKFSLRELRDFCRP